MISEQYISNLIKYYYCTSRLMSSFKILIIHVHLFQLFFRTCIYFDGRYGLYGLIGHTQ